MNWLKHIAQRSWQALCDHVNEPHPPMSEMWWRLFTALIVSAASFVSALCGVGMWYIVHSLIGDAYYISDTILMITVVPAALSMAFGGLVALHSRKFNTWVWRFITGMTLVYVIGGATLAFAG